MNNMVLKASNPTTRGDFVMRKKAVHLYSQKVNILNAFKQFTVNVFIQTEYIMRLPDVY